MGSVGAHPLIRNGPDYELELSNECVDTKYQDVNKHFTYLLEDLTNMSYGKHEGANGLTLTKDLIAMAQKQDNETHWHPTSTKELNVSKLAENSYTGMNKQESKKARGAIEKLIYISAFFITKTIVIYRDILWVCSNFTSSLVFPEPACQQYKTISSVTKLLLFETCSFKKEEDIHSLFVYWYYFIMSVKENMEHWMHSKLYDKYTHILADYATHLMRYTLDQIYKKHRINDMESFEVFIKRILSTQKNFKDNFSKDEILKITSHDRFDITLLDKCINIFTGYYSLDKIYETNKLINTESFEGFIKRVILASGLTFETEFSVPERMKITSYTNFNANLTNKCIKICINKCKSIALPSIAQDYLRIQDISKKIKDRRNDHFHNLPEPGIFVCKEFYKKLNELELLLNDLVKFTRNLFPSSCPEKKTKYMELKFILSKIPASFSDIYCIISVSILFCIFFLY